MIILGIDVGIKNLGCCIYDKKEKCILDWQLLRIEFNRAHQLVPKLIEALKTLDISNVDKIVIEKQPSCNVKMRIIAGCIETFFVMHDKTVIHYSASHKLNDIITTDVTYKGKKNYSTRKRLSIELCKHMIDSCDEKWKEIFKSTKKKDDLADAYLMCIAWCKEDHCIDIKLSPRKIVCRKPTDKQIKTGKYSVSNLKWIIKLLLEEKKVSVDDAPEFIKNFKFKKKGIVKAIALHFDNDYQIMMDSFNI